MDLKFRTPVICQNGHKAYWYWEIVKTGIEETRRIKVEPECDCPKYNIGEGWFKNGPDEQYTGLLDKNKKGVYVGDIVRHKSFSIKEITFGSPEANLDSLGFMYNRTIAFLNPTDTGEVEVIGSTYLSPELLNK